MSTTVVSRSVTARRVSWAAPLIAACVLSIDSCATRKAPSQHNIAIDALPAGTNIPPTWSAPSTLGGVANEWLSTFHDPQLAAIVAEAIANNPDLRRAGERVEQARQTVNLLSAQLKPSISGTFSGAGTVVEPSGDAKGSYATYGLLSWELDLWGKLRAQRAAAFESYQAVGLDYAFARQSLAATVAECWYVAVETRQLLALAQDNVNNYQRLLELAKVRKAAGKVADLDVAEARAALDQTQSQLLQAQGEFSDVKRSLQVLLGRYPSSEIGTAEKFATLPPPVRAGIPSSLLERRPDIISAEREVRAAFYSYEVARLAFYPTISLSLGSGHLDDLLLAARGSSLFHTAMGMSMPIYQGGALRAQVRIATEVQRQAVAHYGTVLLRAFKEVETALTDEDLLSQRFPFETHAVEDRSEAVRLAEIKYRYGTADLFLVLTLQTEQISQQIQLIKLHYALLTNRIKLHLALGGSFDDVPAAATVNP
jgi:multidrug efflux system outer membrane protein